jgi:hypothetical protein
MLMEDWMSDHRGEIDQAHAERKMKGTEESFKRRCSPDNLVHLNEKRFERREILAATKYWARRKRPHP